MEFIKFDKDQNSHIKPVGLVISIGLRVIVLKRTVLREVYMDMYISNGTWLEGSEWQSFMELSRQIRRRFQSQIENPQKRCLSNPNLTLHGSEIMDEKVRSCQLFQALPVTNFIR
jgi:hypothetical protein